MRRKSYITYALLAIQIIIYLLMEVTGSSLSISTLLHFGAKENALIAIYGQYWRLITPIFVHIGFSHLLFNSITLWYLGSEVEGIIGSWRFLFIYLYSGIMGNLFSYQFSTSVSAGASTALFGLFAFFLAMRYLNPHDRYFQAMGYQYQTLIILNIVMNLFMANVDMSGHIGGIIGGFLATLIITNNPKHRLSSILLSILVYSVIAGIIIANHGAFNTLFIH
ncbi:rhomboid family intramembrane serine protease [Aerococcus urinae]|uniref:rhomboid family intramembrane serine protease n=1 Tax=Aerococcus urinae TaxID=1376 RepID=UPI0018A75AEF|nr:rhomboid family intramembrane serine protease [Aerococcus urinae]